uniref:Uncharacterized protein n=1 Tax=Rhizophora mucronata TaxID=61149 RepID=A0A2P2P1F2_RHIMU
MEDAPQYPRNDQSIAEWNDSPLPGNKCQTWHSVPFLDDN